MERPQYKTEVFEGPLDLLLHLIAKHKLNINDIPIFELVEQYIAYVKQMQEENMEIASEFLEMAARLVYIKTVSLLPVYEEVSKLENVEITFYRDVYSPELWYIEIFSSCASKKKAVEFLRDYLHPERIICFGDNLNDIPMFEAADHSIAVENAVAAVKEAADEIIGKNTDNAVAAYISERFR